MPRHVSTPQVRPERLAEHRQRHAAVRPEVLAALRDLGPTPLETVFDLDAQLSAPAQSGDAP